jgi:TolB-like protein
MLDNFEEAYLAEAITEDLTVGLTKFEYLRIIACQQTRP